MVWLVKIGHCGSIILVYILVLFQLSCVANHTLALKTSACYLFKNVKKNQTCFLHLKQNPREHVPRGNTPILPVHVAKEIMHHGSLVCWGLKTWNAPYYTEPKRGKASQKCCSAHWISCSVSVLHVTHQRAVKNLKDLLIQFEVSMPTGSIHKMHIV